jgi:uncharacterized protein (TIGR02145 family)
MKKITYLMLLLLAGPALAQDECNLQYDGNGDGAVNIQDVLGVLSEFGEVCEPVIEYGPCGSDSTVSYHGYDYSLVEIGGQCWFAENLRTELYANGDTIASILSDSEWEITTNGAVAVYGEDEGCENFSPDGDACDSTWSLNEYGRLYNWYAVDDIRGLCPTGWHVSTDEEWMTLEMELGMSEAEANDTGWRGTDQGTQMKTTYGWYEGGNGTNSSGFSGLPGAYRFTDGNFYASGKVGRWWCSTQNLCRFLYWDHPEVRRQYTSAFNNGYSVRCIMD